MKYETSVVYLEQIPKVAVDSGFDWATFFSFMATIAVFSLGTWLTIRSSNKNYAQQEQFFKDTIKAQADSLRSTHDVQEKISRSNAVKISRQAWIDSLREACSNYLSLLLIMNGHVREKDSKLGISNALTSMKELVKGAEVVTSWLQARNDLRLKIFELKYRIELLSNPKEDLFRELLELVNEGVSSCESSSAQDLVVLCEKIKVVAQQILKIEWDRTKNML